MLILALYPNLLNVSLLLKNEGEIISWFMIVRFSSTMDIKSVASILNMSVDELEKYKKRKVTICDFLCFLDLPLLNQQTMGEGDLV